MYTTINIGLLANTGSLIFIPVVTPSLFYVTPLYKKLIATPSSKLTDPRGT